MSNKHPQFSYALMLELQDHTCFYCSKKLASVGHSKETPNGYTRDHFFPRSWGNTLNGNMVLACSKCNRKKDDHLPTNAEVHRFAILWSRIQGGTSMDLTDFFQYQRLINSLSKIIGPRVDTKHII